MTTTDVLRGVPLFQGMSDRSIETIADLATPTTFEPGAILIAEDTPGETFLVLTDGTAEVTRGGAPLRTVGAGDFLGEISLIDGGPRTATVTAATPVEALVIDRTGFGRLMAEFPVVRPRLRVRARPSACASARRAIPTSRPPGDRSARDRVEPVADAADGDQVDGGVGVGLDLGAHPADVHVDRCAGRRRGRLPRPGRGSGGG